MGDSINVTIRLDKEIKKDAEELFRNFGMNLSTALNIFIRQSLRQGKIPFEICDPFYSEKNQERLKHSIANAEMGKLTIHELIEN
jgi:DNA-damage-inducible protein J